MAFWDSWFGKKKTDQGTKVARRGSAAKAKPAAPKPAPNPALAKRKLRTNIEKRFKLQNRIGQGSMSKVWLATDSETGQMVVVKILDKPKTEALKKRFVGLIRPDEGEIAVMLDHPNVVKTFEWGTTSKSEEYLVMEYVNGVGFNFLVETRAKQLVGHELEYLIQMGEAIEYFHQRGYIHRDICPRNVMVNKENVVKLIDFGLAVPNTPEFRRPGNRTGTANYMAPELIRRVTTDQRIDVYSFGVTVYETLTGKLPHENVSAGGFDAMLKHINSPARDPRDLRPELSPELAAMVIKGIQPNPDRRFQSIRAYLEEMRRLAT